MLSNLDNNVGVNDFSDSVQIYYKELIKYQPISKERERELLVRAKDGDIKSRNEIITANLRFVFDIAKKYRGRGVDIADLIEEGNKGIIKAIEKFDLSKDVKFFTYAVWWIRQHMLQIIEDTVNPNEVNFDDFFTGENQSINNVSVCDDCEDDVPDTDIIKTNDDVDILEMNEDSNQKHFVVQKLLATLDEKERLVVMKYFGIENDDDGHSFDEIGNELKLSTERIRQLKIKAINTMRAEAFNISEANFLFN